MIRIPLSVLGLSVCLLLAAGPAPAATIWQCEVSSAYDLGATGAHERDASSRYAGNRFTANDETGEVIGPNLGDAKDWKGIPRQFGPNQDGLQSLRSAAGRLLQHLYVESFAPGPAKPFVLSELDIGASRTGLCSAGP